MKNKTTTYVLIIGVAAVWGIIFYRIFTAMTDGELPTIAAGVVKTTYFVPPKHQGDSLSLEVNYRDPFAKSSTVVEQVVTKAKPMMNTVSIPTGPPPVNWNAIVYSGYIVNPTSKQRIAILQVNGVEAMLAEGQGANGLRLIKFLGDSLLVKYKNATKYISLK